MPVAITKPFRQARETLNLDGGADEKTVRRAYRKAVAKHPPDRDPDRFREIRSAYELLSDPITRADHLLQAPLPHTSPPPLPDVSQEPEVPFGHAILRAIAGRIPVAILLDDEQTKP